MSYLDSKFVAADGCDRDSRQRKLIRAQMFRKQLPEQSIIIRTVSRRGIGANSQGCPPIKGEEIVILLPFCEEMTGVVRWVDGSSFGVALDRDLDMETLTRVIQHHIEMNTVKSDWEVRSLHRVPAAVASSKLRRV